MLEAEATPETVWYCPAEDCGQRNHTSLSKELDSRDEQCSKCGAEVNVTLKLYEGDW